jgi:hypothetical protein
MAHFFSAGSPFAGRSIAFALAVSASSIAAAGCGGADAADGPSAAATDDEATESVTNAVIASPSGVVAIDRDGRTSPAGEAVPDAEPAASSGSYGDTESDAGSADDAGGPTGGFGQWHFDDCSSTSHVLVDSSGNGANARQALHADCVPGISGLAVAFRSARDVVEVRDAPQFAVTDRVAVAAWVYPNRVNGHHPIVVKRLNDDTSFSLGVHDGNVAMSVVTARGKTVIARAPIAARTWTHVAGMYDGTSLFLFVNGQTLAQVSVGRRLRDVFAPIRIGATTRSQFFDGIIDEVFVSTQSIPQSTLTALACVDKPTTVSISPTTGGPVTFDTPVHYDVVVTNNSLGGCGPIFVTTFAEITDPTLSEQFTGASSTIAPGTSADVGVDVTANDSATPGVHLLPLKIEVVVSPPPNFVENTSIVELAFDLAPASEQ